MQVFAPLFALDVLDIGSGGLGIMLTITGVGALAAALFIAKPAADAPRPDPAGRGDHVRCAADLVLDRHLPSEAARPAPAAGPAGGRGEPPDQLLLAEQRDVAPRRPGAYARARDQPPLARPCDGHGWRRGCRLSRRCHRRAGRADHLRRHRDRGNGHGVHAQQLVPERHYQWGVPAQSGRRPRRRRWPAADDGWGRRRRPRRPWLLWLRRLR